MSDTFTIRDAMRADLPAIVAMLADDPLGATREQGAARGELGEEHVRREQRGIVEGERRGGVHAE